MLHHIVMWQLKGEAEGNTKAENLAEAVRVLRSTPTRNTPIIARSNPS